MPAAAPASMTAAAVLCLIRGLLVAVVLSVGLRPVAALSSLSECSSGLGPLPPVNGSLLSHFFSNTAFAPSASSPYCTNSTFAYSSSLAFSFPEALPASFLPADSRPPYPAFSFQVHGHLQAERSALYSFSCRFNASELSVLLWLDDQLLCPATASQLRLQLPASAGQLLHVRLEVIQRGRWQPQPQPQLEVRWSSGLGLYTAVPSSALLGCLSRPRLQQLAMHERQLTGSGWDQLYNADFLTQTLLPHSLALTLSLYRLSTASFRKGFMPQRADGSSGYAFRIGNRTWVGDTGIPYQSLQLSWSGLSLQLETTSDRSSNELTLLITAISASNYTDYRLVITSSHLWDRAGHCTALDGRTPGRPFALCESAGIAPAIPVYSSAPVSETQLPGVDSAALGGIAAFAFPASSSPSALPVLAFTTGSAPPVSASQQRMREAAAVAAAAPCLPSALQRASSPPAEECLLIQTTLAWLSIFTPYEGLIQVVARDWDGGGGFGYVLFEWDSFFTVLMLSTLPSPFAKQQAVATFVQMVKASTRLPDGTGCIPNYASGPRVSRDRTEPPIAAKVLLELVQAWGTDDEALQWLLPLCLPDLLRENSWFWTHRRAAPLGLIALGSEPNLPIAGIHNVLQAAVDESGLDNSPMYDGAVFDNHTHLLQLYDVGMSSLFLAGCLALMQIASLSGLGREAVPLLSSRYDEMAPLMSALWDDASGIFVNRRINDSAAVPRLSPTSFYPMLAALPSVAQAERMLRLHLLSDDEFCVSDSCPGLPLPSIARNDAAYGEQQYWRGRQWGPHVMLLWWALEQERYAGSRLVQQARQQLVRQAGGIWQPEWRAHRHVHENYNGDAPEGCNVADSDPLYSWGALNPYVTLLEQLRGTETHSASAAAD